MPSHPLQSNNISLVLSKAEAGIVQRQEFTKPASDARQTFYLIGATSVFLAFYDYGAAVAKEARIVFNAVDNADADAKAVAAGSRSLVKIGQSETFPFDDSSKCTRVDVYSDATAAGETGTTKLVLEGVSP